jgi:hypothetical protein
MLLGKLRANRPYLPPFEPGAIAPKTRHLCVAKLRALC